MNLPLTLGLMALNAALFALTAWRASRPSEPPKVRLVPWTLLTIVLGAFFLLLLANLFSLFGIETGQGFPRL